MSLTELAMLALAAVGAGAINALAGGGSILTFPALIAAGIPPVAANVTNTVALCPGYVGGVIGQWRDLSRQGRRLLMLLPVAAIGALIGGLLILRTSDHLFEGLIPPLVLGACILLASQDRVKGLVQRGRGAVGLGWAMLPVLLASVYGGYFGAGLSVMFLAVLGIALDDTITRLNALKQVMGLTVNLTAALLFAASPGVVWPAALVMAAGALVGGAIGGRFASVIRPQTLRRIVVAIGVLVAIAFVLR